MKLGIVGKGGTGKTALAALLAQVYVEGGKRVLAVDTDSNPNLALSLGLDAAAAERAAVLPRSLVVGFGGGAITPAELVGEYGLSTPAGVTLLHAMSVDEAGAGCMCSSHSSVRSLLAAAIESEADVTVVDMEAGLEHLSRSGGTLAYADVLLVVMEPTRKSVLAAVRIRDLADELGIPRIYAVGNKARRPEDTQFFAQACIEHGLPLAGVVPYEQNVVEAERSGGMLTIDQTSGARRVIAEIIGLVDSVDEQRVGLQRKIARLEQQLAELQTG